MALFGSSVTERNPKIGVTCAYLACHIPEPKSQLQKHNLTSVFSGSWHSGEAEQRPRTSVPFLSDLLQTEKSETKPPQVSWTSGAVCRMWALSSVLPGSSGLSWTDPQYLPISYQHNSLWFPHYHFAHQWTYDACCLLSSTLHFFLQMGE